MLSDVVHGEVIGFREDRTEAAATALLTEELTGRQRAAITAVCTDMHRPYLNAVGEVLKHAEVVFDKFHVLQHASAALDDVRRQEFFRAGAVMREHGRGKRWLLLRRWKTVRGSKREELSCLRPSSPWCKPCRGQTYSEKGVGSLFPVRNLREKDSRPLFAFYVGRTDCRRPVRTSSRAANCDLLGPWIRNIVIVPSPEPNSREE